MPPRALIVPILASLLIGCTAAPRAEGFADVRRLSRDRAGADVHWKQGGDADREVDSRIAGMLSSGPIGADAAVQVALLNNPRLQARYERLGVAQADLVQAGLLANPVFDALLRWPEGGGGANVELAVSASFLDVLFVGARKKIATAELEREKQETADAVLQLAADVRAAFYRAVASRQMLELRRAVLDAEEAAAETARRLESAGNISGLDADREAALYEQARLELIEAEADVARDRDRLAELMGVAAAATNTSMTKAKPAKAIAETAPAGSSPDAAATTMPSDWSVADRLPDPPDADDDRATLEARALNGRLDLAAARAERDALAKTLGLQRGTALLGGDDGDASIGLNTERETDGERVTGPSFSIPIPFFDLGQSRVAAARHRLRESDHRYEALRQQAATEVRLAHQDLSAARRRFEHYRDVVLPLRQRIVEQSQRHYNGMLLSLFELLSAKQAQVEAGSGYLEALRDYWVARAELERAVGGRLPASAASIPLASQPAPATSQPAPAAPDPAQHHHH